MRIFNIPEDANVLKVGNFTHDTFLLTINGALEDVVESKAIYTYELDTYYYRYWKGKSVPYDNDKIEFEAIKVDGKKSPI